VFTQNDGLVVGEINNRENGVFDIEWSIFSLARIRRPRPVFYNFVEAVEDFHLPDGGCQSRLPKSIIGTPWNPIL
jgi:hypothetical protein